MLQFESCALLQQEFVDKIFSEEAISASFEHLYSNSASTETLARPSRPLLIDNSKVTCALPLLTKRKRKRKKRLPAAAKARIGAYAFRYHKLISTSRHSKLSICQNLVTTSRVEKIHQKQMPNKYLYSIKYSY